MPLLTQSDAATRVYAKGFFDMAHAKGGRSHVEQLFDELEQVVEITRELPAFGELLSNPGISQKARAGTLNKAFKGKVSEETLNFLLVLNDKGRISALPAVVDSLDAIVQEQFGRVEVDMFTSTPVPQGDVENVRRRLSEILRKDVVVHAYVESHMMGGVKFRIGDQLIDGSLASRLRRVRDQLARDGVGNLRERIGRVIEG
jgi:F-type H+-transporting ATPase subunit delta